MVPADSDRIPRVPPYSGYRYLKTDLPVRAFHSLWMTFPSHSGSSGFDIKQIDFALSQMISSPIVSLSNIVSFALFPYCGYTWNSFLLESYCYRFSELYRYETLSFNDKNAGVIISRNLKTNYKNILARVVAESGIILSQDSVMSYLCQNGYIAKRRYAAIDEVIEMAKVLRQEKK